MGRTHYLAACLLFCSFLSSSLSYKSTVFSLTVAAKDRKVEVTYKGLSYNPGDKIFITSIDGKNLYSFDPSPFSSYHKSKVTYKYTNAREFNKSSRCHSYRAVYYNNKGEVIASTCLSVHPTWINDLVPKIGNKRVRDLIIPGTHDSGSYIEAFKIPLVELRLTGYTLTQDDTILGQLYNGARYLDIRPAFYNLSPPKWYVNHGFTIQQTLVSVMEQVVQFVKETGEPVIFGLKEFPIGFEGKEVHRGLVMYMVNYFGNYLIKPKGVNPWKSTLNELMANKDARIILAYDDRNIVDEFSHVLFPAVYQNWGNVRKWKELEGYLRSVSSYDPLRLSDNPVSDMAELTPTQSDIIFNQLGGLRQMADDVNLNLCDLYENELYPSANIISVDFIKGTRITELAIYRNGLL